MNVPFDYEEVTVGASAVTLDQAKAAQADDVTLRIASAPIRYRFDRVNPTATFGVPGEDGELLSLNRAEAIGFRAIRSDSTDSLVRAIYYRRE